MIMAHRNVNDNVYTPNIAFTDWNVPNTTIKGVNRSLPALHYQPFSIIIIIIIIVPLYVYNVHAVNDYIFPHSALDHDLALHCVCFPDAVWRRRRQFCGAADRVSLKIKVSPAMSACSYKPTCVELYFFIV